MLCVKSLMICTPHPILCRW